LMKLDELLRGEAVNTVGGSRTSTPAAVEKDGVRFESYPLPQGEPLRCEFIGEPQRFATGRLTACEARQITLDERSFCLGLGAFAVAGANGADAGAAAVKEQGRFGEALGVAGIAVEQATDGSRLPDFQVARGEMLPALELLYGIHGHGDFSHLIRFEAGRSERGTVRFTEFLESMLAAYPCEVGCFALVVEAAAVVGASLIRSPTEAGGVAPWTYPGIRNWLSFTSEQSDDRKLALIVGVACKTPAGRMREFVRPIREGSSVHGHFHAAVLPYRPLPKGPLPLRETVQGLFKMDTPRSVLHMLADDRPIEGVGQTELMRGACWFGPVAEPPGVP
jgi:hypothetical protein